MPKLTDTQLVILSAAAGSDDGAVLPLPASLTINKGAAASVLKGLIKKGLIDERPAAAGAEIWREADDGERLTLAIADAGLAAIGVEPAETSGRSATRAKSTSKKPRRAAARPSGNTGSAAQAASAVARAGTKQATLIDLLRRKQGATIAEISEATGWQAHSVRGAISGALKKKLSLTVTSAVEEDRGRVYRIAGTA